MSISDPTVLATTDAGVLATAARPWGPFALGFIVGVGISLWALFDASWRMRHNAGPTWEYDTEYHRAWANLKRMNLRWSVILGGPFVCGIVVWLVWSVLSILAGVGGA